MDLKTVELEILKEQACIEDLLTVIGIHTKSGRLDLAAKRGADMQASIKRIQELKCKQLQLIAQKFQLQNVNVKVVKKHAYQS